MYFGQMWLARPGRIGLSVRNLIYFMKKAILPQGLGLVAIVVLGASPKSEGASIIQEESLFATGWEFPATFGYVVPGSEPGGNGFYGLAEVAFGPPGEFVWSPLLSGAYDLEVSWAIFSTHASTSSYFFDPDGVGGPAPEVQLLFTGNTGVANSINQRRDNTGALQPEQTWSGFYPLADSLSLTPDSTIRVTGNINLTSGVWRFTSVPEPGSSILVLLGGTALLVGRRRG